MKAMLKLFFISLPFYFTSDFRLNIGSLSITLNIIVLLLITIMLFFIKKSILKINKKDIPLFFILILFLMLHLFSYNINLNDILYLKHIVHIFLALIFFYISYIIGYKFINTNNFNMYVKLFIYSSTILLIMYIYVYIFILHAPFLGILLNNNELTTAGKNQAQLFIALSFPLLLGILNKNIIIILCLFVYLFATIYIGSRGLWVSLAVSLFIFLILKKKHLFIVMSSFFKSLVIAIIITVITLGLFNVKINYNVFNEAIDAFSKLILLYEGQDNSDSSVSEREIFIKQGIANLADKPILGNGLGYFLVNNPYEKVSHNDYIFLLSDMGLLGFIVYILFIIVLNYRLKYTYYFYYLLPFFIDLLFVNAYTVPLFWILSGLYLGQASQMKKGE